MPDLNEEWKIGLVSISINLGMLMLGYVYENWILIFLSVFFLGWAGARMTDLIQKARIRKLFKGEYQHER